MFQVQRGGAQCPATPDFGTVVRTEYLVRSVNEPELCKAFKSFAKMQVWFKEHGQLKVK
jgi:hypothetical protein